MKALLKQSRYISRALMVGCWTLNKYQLQARNSSTLQAAKNMRKQGYSLPLALITLSVRG